VLTANLVRREVLTIDAPTKIIGAGVDLGLAVEAFAVEGKIALYLEDAAADRISARRSAIRSACASAIRLRRSLFLYSRLRKNRQEARRAACRSKAGLF